jgi:phosphoglycolate phosphatase/pyrophosphatase PpaX
MARAAGVDFAAAGWAYSIPEIESFMRQNCDYYLKTVSELRALLFEE